MAASLTIDTLFNGPDTSANGGYACGCMAEAVVAAGHQCVRVNLRAPPPLGRPLKLEVDDEAHAQLHDPDNEGLVAEAQPGACELELPTPPGFDTAVAWSRNYTGFGQHALPNCFVCGPGRSESDGLRVFAGRADPEDLQTAVAAPWRPHPAFANPQGSLSPRLLWAVLDCPGYFAIAHPGELALLASMTGRVESMPEVDEACVVMGWPLARQGRKLRAATAAFGEDGRVLGFSEQLWIQLRPAPKQP